MKISTFVFAFLFPVIALTQASFHGEPENGDTSVLTSMEAIYLNDNLALHRGDFNFEGKKILFAKGNNAINLLSKNEYFNKEIKPWAGRNLRVSNTLVVFSEAEKQQSGGYDALVVAWTKYGVTKKRKQKILEELKNRSSSGT